MTSEQIKERRKRGRPRIQPAMVNVTMPASTLRMIEKNHEWIERQRETGALDEQRYMTSETAAKFLGMSKSNLLNYLKEEIGFVRLKRAILFDRENLISYMESRKIKKSKIA